MMINGGNWIFFKKALLVADVGRLNGGGKRLGLRSHRYLVKVDQVLL
jgi:hypothetical protein